ncbi:DinB family protein [Cryobacterium sp. PH29-G1]|uniref:DinB family protein n=1 Tax=Cryobacterium sp. PH29-G1 TaxID=3046211 RepID=UPI0024BA163A|nr:DinB family protein [Cryobacterium sp. PH29-G1]MDJ0350545.1 DinB family protein [Cryobacterium sp. PH29-G1]
MSRIDPQPSTNERATLLEFLDYQRATVLMKAEGLGVAEMNQPISTSTLTLSGLLKHLALVEDYWVQVRFLGLPEQEPWASAPWDDDRDWEFHSAQFDDPNELRDLYRAASERTRQALIGIDLDTLSVGENGDGTHWNLRWILTHLIEETARHNGHADLLREAIDGTVGE